MIIRDIKSVRVSEGGISKELKKSVFCDFERANNNNDSVSHLSLKLSTESAEKQMSSAPLTDAVSTFRFSDEATGRPHIPSYYQAGSWDIF